VADIRAAIAYYGVDWPAHANTNQAGPLEGLAAAVCDPAWLPARVK